MALNKLYIIIAPVCVTGVRWLLFELAVEKGCWGFHPENFKFGGQAYKLRDDPAKSGTVGKYVNLK